MELFPICPLWSEDRGDRGAQYASRIFDVGGVWGVADQRESDTGDQRTECEVLIVAIPVVASQSISPPDRQDGAQNSGRSECAVEGNGTRMVGKHAKKIIVVSL